jgi:phosphatidylserine decarboxylase
MEERKIRNQILKSANYGYAGEDGGVKKPEQMRASHAKPFEFLISSFEFFTKPGLYAVRTGCVSWRAPIHLMRLQTLREARWIFAVLAAVTYLLGKLLHPLASLPGVALILYTFYFFRDPDRTAPSDPLAVVAPADGLVVEIIEKTETEIVNGTMRRVAIFLSVFDVHTNRSPIDAEVIYRKHYPGKFLDARNPECSVRNESQTWGFRGGTTTLVVRQITGAIARRIVAWSKVGDRVARGERFGMIRFGSRTEIYLPLDSHVVVSLGDRVKGGETVIARLSTEVAS